MAVERFAVFQFYKLGVMCQGLLRGGGWTMIKYHGLVLGSCQE